MFLVHDCRKTILAQGVTLTMDTRKSRLNNNVLIVGSSGRGKTRNVIKPNIMQMNSSYVISDPKGRLVLELGDMLESHGYKVKVLNLIDMAKSNSYNPFHYVKSDADVYKLIEYIMVNVNPAFYFSKDPFWDNAAKALLSAIVFYLRSECPEEDQTFCSVMKMLRCLEVRECNEEFLSTLDIMFKLLKEKDPEHIAVRQYAVFKAAASRTAASIAVTTSVLLQWFNLAEYEALTATDSIEMENIGKELTALFVITSDTDRSKNWLAGVFYSQLLDVLCQAADAEHNGSLPVHVRFVLDDFASTAKIPYMDDKMAMIRSREISCIIVIQDEAQLEKEYGPAARGIISNCESYIFLGSSNIDSCDIAARRLANPEITGAVIRELEYDQCVVICGNEGGIYKKYNIKDHPRYDLIADSSKDSFYDLVGKHSIFSVAKPQTKHSFQPHPTHLKDSLFDSREEEYLYQVLNMISNISVHVHQQLRDVFQSSYTAFSMKLSYMHCDFIIRNSKLMPLFGIEIDGKQHRSNPDQVVNDSIKNNFFEINGVPLLRFTAAEVRTDISNVLDKILKTADGLDDKKHILCGSIPVYKDRPVPKETASLDTVRRIHGPKKP